MESFLRRLKYYGIGFLIGLIFVFIFFQNRGCSWLPSNRVKNAFLDRLIVITEDQLAIMKSKGISENDIIEVLNDGEVSFNDSDTEGDLKVYKLSKNIDGKGDLHFFFTMPSESFISEVKLNVDRADQVKSATKGLGRIIHFPKDDHLVFLDSTELITCKLRALEVSDADALFKRIKNNGKIDFSKTKLNEKPKAIQYFSIHDSSQRKYGIKAIWYKNKINVVAVDADSTVKCP